MRTVAFLIIATAAAVAALPGSARAQSSPAEIPCVGYATFERNGSDTELIGLAIGDVPAGAKVTMSCTGVSCPFSTKTFTMHNPVKTLALTDMFRDPIFKPGTVLELRVTKAGWIGKVFQYEIRSSEDPLSKTQCLSEDGSKTLVCSKGTGQSRR